jgi:steroid 5-alpha reductase family enzyme
MSGRLRHPEQSMRAYPLVMAADRDNYRVGGSLAATSRVTGFTLVTLTYVAACLAAGAVVATMPVGHPLHVAFWADVIATLVVFAASTAVANASLYDPYWSVAPPVIAAGWVLGSTGGDLGAATGRQWAVLLLILAWAIRLTANWAVSWRGLSHEDWRYVQLREQRPAGVPWWLVNLAGIQMMPTLVVFAGLLAVWPAVSVTSRPWGPLDVAAVVVTGGAILLEALSDRQLHRFAGDPANRGRIVDVGLWRYSRHPNYLGEILFWWGLWLFGLAAAPDWWWTVIGPISMVLLFTFVSVPMMDRRSAARRPGYARHMRRVPALFPRPPRDG